MGLKVPKTIPKNIIWIYLYKFENLLSHPASRVLSSDNCFKCLSSGINATNRLQQKYLLSPDDQGLVRRTQNHKPSPGDQGKIFPWISFLWSHPELTKALRASSLSSCQLTPKDNARTSHLSFVPCSLNYVSSYGFLHNFLHTNT